MWFFYPERILVYIFSMPPPPGSHGAFMPESPTLMLFPAFSWRRHRSGSHPILSETGRRWGSPLWSRTVHQRRMDRCGFRNLSLPSFGRSMGAQTAENASVSQAIPIFAGNAKTICLGNCWLALRAFVQEKDCFENRWTTIKPPTCE